MTNDLGTWQLQGAEESLAAVYGDIVEAARRDALTEAAEAVAARQVHNHPDRMMEMACIDDGCAWYADAARIVTDLLAATAPRTAPNATLSDQDTVPRTPTTPEAAQGDSGPSGHASWCSSRWPLPRWMNAPGRRGACDCALPGTDEAQKRSEPFPISPEAESFIASAKILAEPYEERIAELEAAAEHWQRLCVIVADQAAEYVTTFARVRALCDEAERLAGDRIVGVVGSSDIRAVLDGTEDPA